MNIECKSSCLVAILDTVWLMVHQGIWLQAPSQRGGIQIFINRQNYPMILER